MNIMNWKRLSLTAATIFVIGLAWNGLIHGLVLRDANEALDGVARPLAQRPLALGLALTVGIAVLFAYSYAAFVRTPGVKRALGHGVFFALLTGLLVDLNQYVLYPIPASLAAAWFVFGLIEFCLYGVVACWLYPFPATIDGTRGSGAS
ncbi:MAG TPA: hypothetical protein VNJ47_09820 [Nevskiales bacterium]|nr:hypothetical protein [Nevskiales bacterium]